MRPVEQPRRSNTTVRTQKKFEPPTLQECIVYARDNELLVNAYEFHRFFVANEWHDSNNKPVNRWKGKMLTWHSFEVKRDCPRECAVHKCKKPGVYDKGKNSDGHTYFYCHTHRPSPPPAPKIVQKMASGLCEVPPEPKPEPVYKQRKRLEAKE